MPSPSFKRWQGLIAQDLIVQDLIPQDLIAQDRGVPS
jgi:hypothetical protein